MLSLSILDLEFVFVFQFGMCALGASAWFLGVNGNNRRGKGNGYGFAHGFLARQRDLDLGAMMRELMSAMGKDWLDHDGDDHLLLPLFLYATVPIGLFLIWANLMPFLCASGFVSAWSILVDICVS